MGFPHGGFRQNPAAGGGGGGAPSGPAGGDLGGTYPNPTVVAVEETGGPTRLPFGAISANQWLRLVAGSIVGAALPAQTTVANDPIWDAAGDLVYGTGADTATRLPAGVSLRDRLMISGTAPVWKPHVIRRSSTSAARNSGNTGSTLTDDTQLLFAVAANEVYFFQAWLIVTAANTTMDAKFGWSVPVGATMTWGGLGTAGATSPGGYGVLGVTGSPAAILTAAQSFSVGTAAGTFGYCAAGVVTNGANAGNVTFQWAQDVANASDLTLNINSLLLLWPLA